VKPGTPCTPSGTKLMSGPFSQSTSNLEDNGIIDAVLQQNINSTSIQIYPNPVKDELTIELNTDISHFDKLSVTLNARLEIVNIIGQTVFSSHIQHATETIDVSGLPTGAYIIKLKTEQSTAFRKFVKE
jgi:hypothetical protein